MLIEIPSTKVVNITHVLIKLPVRYEEEDIPNDFPLREGDLWRAKINVDSGKIENWTEGRAGVLYMKVVDGGSYHLLSGDKIIASIEGDYVPHGVIPGEYGDYVNLEINASGTIENWSRDIDVDAFFPER